VPVYTLPAADVSRLAKQAAETSPAAVEARAALAWWHTTTHGQTVDAALAAGEITDDDAMMGSPLGMYTRKVEKTETAARRKIELAYTLITPREVTAALRTIFPQCTMTSRDAGENLIDVTLPERPARQLFGDGQDNTQPMVHRLLPASTEIAGRRTWRARDCSRMITVTLKFPVAS
jgi:hypothetical protein